MHFVGATIIAGVIFFLLNLLSTLWLDGRQTTALAALLEAALKTAVFVTLFHYLHNWIAGLLRWYRVDEPGARHRLDRMPAHEAAPSERGPAHEAAAPDRRPQ